MSDSDRGWHPLHVRVTDAELDQIREQAIEAGHPTTSAYLRSLLGLPVLWRGRPEKRRVIRRGDKNVVARRDSVR